MPHAIYQLFFSIHRYSIDIALGAAAVLFGLNLALSLQIPLYYYVLLVNGTFIVYWIDHIQDSSKALLSQAGARHAVFKEQRVLFVLLIALLFCINGFIALAYLPTNALFYGALLFLAMLGYLRFHRVLKRVFILEKEILISSLYTLSVSFAPWLYFSSDFVLDWLVFVLCLLSIFLTTLQNLFSIARIEKEQDQRAQIRNICQQFGSARLKNLQELMLLLQVVTATMLLLLFPELYLFRFLGLLLLVSGVQYALPLLFREPQNILYRCLGDGAYALLFLCGL